MCRRDEVLNTLMHNPHSPAYLRGLAVVGVLIVLVAGYAVVLWQLQTRRGGDTAQGVDAVLQRFWPGKAKRQQKLI